MYIRCPKRKTYGKGSSRSSCGHIALVQNMPETLCQAHVHRLVDTHVAQTPEAFQVLSFVLSFFPFSFLLSFLLLFTLVPTDMQLKYMKFSSGVGPPSHCMQPSGCRPMMLLMCSAELWFPCQGGQCPKQAVFVLTFHRVPGIIAQQVSTTGVPSRSADS